MIDMLKNIKRLNALKVDIIDNSNILSELLHGSGLHLSIHGKG